MGRLRQLLRSRRPSLPPSTDRQEQIERYKRAGRIPWSEGYTAYKWDFIQETLASSEMMTRFRQFDSLPSQFGLRLDERVVEYPWILAHLPENNVRLLDAGSALNHEVIVTALRNLNLTILTLAPEGQAFWQRGISYHYGDIRRMPFRDDWFDHVVCISTLEHIGMDNSYYGASPTETSEPEFQVALREMLRVLKPGGLLLITVPFGKAQDLVVQGNVFARQFDAAMLRQLLATIDNQNTYIYQYTKDGWNTSTQEACATMEYYNIHAGAPLGDDFAAAARAVACIEIRKP
jgi:SAM-dependent methyltransferase